MIGVNMRKKLLSDEMKMLFLSLLSFIVYEKMFKSSWSDHQVLQDKILVFEQIFFQHPPHIRKMSLTPWKKIYIDS